MSGASAAAAAAAASFTEPTTEAELLALVPAAEKDSKLGLAMVLLESCIYHGWLSAIPTLAAAKSCQDNESSQVQLLENAMYSNDYEEEKSVQIWQMLETAWPHVIEKNLDYLATKSLEISPIVVWKQMLDKLKSIKTKPGELASSLSFLKGAGKTQAHKDALQQAMDNCNA